MRTLASIFLCLCSATLAMAQEVRGPTIEPLADVQWLFSHVEQTGARIRNTVGGKTLFINLPESELCMGDIRVTAHKEGSADEGFLVIAGTCGVPVTIEGKQYYIRGNVSVIMRPETGTFVAVENPYLRHEGANLPKGNAPVVAMTSDAIVRLVTAAKELLAQQKKP